MLLPHEEGALQDYTDEIRSKLPHGASLVAYGVFEVLEY